MLNRIVYIYNLNASDVYLFNKYGQAYFDDKYKSIDPLRWKHKSILNDSLDIDYINPKRIPEDKIYQGFINISFEYSVKNGTETLLDTRQLRELFYRDGFDFNGKHYIRYKRSSGSSREGKCLFIEERLSKDMFPWSKCGLKAEDGYESNLVSYEAYRSLSLSNVEKIINLDPHNILVVEDYDSIFKDNNSVGVDIVNKQLVVSKDKEIQISNSIWDGEGLLDESVFSEYGYENKGMMLLRNRFFKCCAFNTRLQFFLKEMMEQGVIKSVKDLNGYTEAKNIEDVLLVITHSSLKYLKLSNKPLNEKINKWMNNVSSSFGVVKTDKPTHEFKGEMVDTSYQFINTIGLNKEQTNELVKPYLEYRDMIRNDSDMYLFYSKMHKYDEPDKNTPAPIPEKGYERLLDYREISFTVCEKLMKYNKDFEKTKLYGSYVSKLMARLREDAYLGRLLIAGTNATLFGNGYELLLNIVNKFEKKSPVSLIKPGEISCSNFADNELIVGARSPHITMGNLYLATNKHYDELDKYFNLSKEIVAVNAINENIQQKLNGADYDSDTMLLTNNKVIVSTVKEHYQEFKVPVCLAKSTNLTHSCSKKDMYIELARIDIDISQNHIGEAVNLSQILNSVYWDKYHKGDYEQLDEIYATICKLAVVSGMEIDKAKRSYDVNVDVFLANARKFAYKLTNDKKPQFFHEVDKQSPYSYKKKAGKRVSLLKKDDYSLMETPMDYVYQIIKENPLKPLYRDSMRKDISELINSFKGGGTGSVFTRDFLFLVKDLQRTIDQIYKEGYDQNLEEAIVFGEVNYKLSEAVDVLKNALKNPATLCSIIRALEADKDNDRVILLSLFLILEDKYQEWKNVFIHNESKLEVVESEDEEGFKLFDKFYTKVPKRALS